MLKDFKTLQAIDVSKYTEKRDGFDYLNWARCKALLHENGAEIVMWEPYTNEKGSSLIMSDREFHDKDGNVSNCCYEVRVRITIDDLVFEQQAPLMSGKTPVKDYYLTAQQVYNAQARAFVKGVAIRTGLGFDLWLKEDTGPGMDEDLSQHKIWAIRKRFEQTFSQLIAKGQNMPDIMGACNSNEKIIKRAMDALTYLEDIEPLLRKLNRDTRA